MNVRRKITLPTALLLAPLVALHTSRTLPDVLWFELIHVVFTTFEKSAVR